MQSAPPQIAVRTASAPFGLSGHSREVFTHSARASGAGQSAGLADLCLISVGEVTYLRRVS